MDRVIAETGDLCANLGRAVHEELSLVTKQDAAARLARRLRRYRRLGAE